MNDLLGLALILVYIGGVVDNHPAWPTNLTGWQLNLAVLRAYFWPVVNLFLAILFLIGIAIATIGCIVSKKYRDKLFDDAFKG